MTTGNLSSFLPDLRKTNHLQITRLTFLLLVLLHLLPFVDGGSCQKALVKGVLKAG